MKTLMKAVAMVLTAMLLFCGVASAHDGDDACTEEDILTVRTDAQNVEGLEEIAIYLLVHQGDIPFPERACIEGILAGSDFASLDGATYHDGIDRRYIDVIMGVLYIHNTDLSGIAVSAGNSEDPPQQTDSSRIAPGSAAALTPEQLAAMVADNARYMVDASLYPRPEDGERFLPYFQSGDAAVLDEALGVTLRSPREITDTTTGIYGSVARAALITNNSDRTVQLIPARDLTEEDWQKVPGYDPGLIVPWGEEPGTDIIPLGHAYVLAPGESTVVRYTYIGREGMDFTFQSRFSLYVTDGESTELLAGTVLNHVLPSRYNPGACTISGTVYDEQTGLPLPGINVQASRNEFDFAVTDENGRFTLIVPAIRFDSTGNWARTSVFVNEIHIMGADGAGSDLRVDPSYAEECVIVEPRDGGSIELTFALRRKPAQVNYTVQTEHDLGMQAYCVDSAGDIIATAPFHTTFSEEYRYENGYLHVFDKTGKLLFEKRLYGESAYCDVSTDATLVASIVHGEDPGEPDTAVVWDIAGNEVFSYQIPYRENPALFSKPIPPNEGVFTKLHDVELSNDGTLLALETDEGYACVVRMADGQILCDFFMKSGNPYKLFWSADDSVLYTCPDCGTLRATEVATGRVLWEKYIEATIFGWAMTDDTLITSTKATATGYLICTDLATGETRWTLDVGMRNASMCLSHDKTMLFWGTDTTPTNERMLLIDTETGTPLWTTVSGKQAAAFSADDRYIAMRSGGSLTLRTITGEHVYGAIIAPDDNSMSWGMYMSGDCKYIISFAGGRVDARFYGTMYALTLDDDTPLG